LFAVVKCFAPFSGSSGAVGGGPRGQRQRGVRAHVSDAAAGRRPSPAGGPRAVRRPAAPPALLADGGCVLIVRRRTLIRLKHTPSPLGTCVNANKPKDPRSSS